MVFPKSFCSNPDTLSSNSFQSLHSPEKKCNVLAKAQNEFSEFQKKLISTGFRILNFEEDTSKFTPDALFPNNWFCHLPDGKVFLFPMFPTNRREEVREDIIRSLQSEKVIDLRPLVEKNVFLEGTGSLILDHQYKTGFACLSPRTSPQALQLFSELSGYKIISFNAVDSNGQPIYHTNVMMTISPQHVVICMESIPDKPQAKLIEATVKELGKQLVPISYEEVKSFAGNMLFIRGEKSFYWACSTQAYDSLAQNKRELLMSEAPFLHSDLKTIETYGGGGARCLLAEYFTRNQSPHS